MSIAPELISLIEDKIIECISVYENKYPHIKWEIPEIKFDIRSSHLAGQYRYRDNKHIIRLNQTFLNLYKEKYINRTVIHEIAHYIKRKINPYDRPHGYVWKRIMMSFEKDPTRCWDNEYDKTLIQSNAPVRKKRNVVRYHYKCSCANHFISQTKYNRIIRGTKYYCHRCREEIKPV